MVIVTTVIPAGVQLFILGLCCWLVAPSVSTVRHIFLRPRKDWTLHYPYPGGPDLLQYLSCSGLLYFSNQRYHTLLCSFTALMTYWPVEIFWLLHSELMWVSTLTGQGKLRLYLLLTLYIYYTGCLGSSQELFSTLSKVFENRTFILLLTLYKYYTTSLGQRQVIFINLYNLTQDHLSTDRSHTWLFSAAVWPSNLPFCPQA